MVFVAHLKNKMRFTYRNFKFKIPLNCTDGTTLPQYEIALQKKNELHNISSCFASNDGKVTNYLYAWDYDVTLASHSRWPPFR